MTRINLLPLKEKQRAIGQRQQIAIAILGLLVALLIMIVPYMVQKRRIAVLDQEIARTKQELQRYTKLVKEVGELDDLKAELEEKLAIIERLNTNRLGPARVLYDLSVATPEKLWLIEFTERNQVATLIGMSLDNETIAEFMRRLEASPYFSDVDLVETRQARRFKRFIVKARVHYSGEEAASRNGKEPAGPGKRGKKKAG